MNFLMKKFDEHLELETDHNKTKDNISDINRKVVLNITVSSKTLKYT